MKPSTQARIASVVAAATSGRPQAHVYSYGSGQYHQTSTEVADGHVHGWDYDTGTAFRGSAHDPGKLDFHDYEDGAHVQLRSDGEKFQGYHFGTGHHFTGTVRGRSITMYDYGTGSYVNFNA